VPKAAIAHDGHGAVFCFGGVECRSPRPAQAITHGGGANVERRQNGKQVATNVAADVARPQFPFNEFHRRENGALRTTRAKGGRSGQHLRRRVCDGLCHQRIRWHHWRIYGPLAQALRRIQFNETLDALQQHPAGVFARHG